MPDSADLSIEGVPALLPCPFCGGPAVFLVDCEDYVPYCNADGCWAMNGAYATEEEAVAAWNRRENPAITEPVEPEDRCPECAGRGWLVMNEGPAPEHLGEIQRCDCDIFADDEAAIHEARRAGYIVEESGEIVAAPPRTASWP